MKRGECAFVLDDSELSDHDRAELEKFRDLLRRVSDAKAAGVPHMEAARAIYPDVYAEPGEDGGGQ